MARRRVSAALDDDEVRLARELAEQDGISLSAWVARTLRHRLRIAKGLRGVAAYEAEYGPIPPDALRRADEELDRHEAEETGP